MECLWIELRLGGGGNLVSFIIYHFQKTDHHFAMIFLKILKSIYRYKLAQLKGGLNCLNVEIKSYITCQSLSLNLLKSLSFLITLQHPSFV